MKILLFCAVLVSGGVRLSAATPDVETTRRAVEVARSVYRALAVSSLGAQETSVKLVDDFLQKFWWEGNSNTYLDLIRGEKDFSINSDLTNGRTILHALAMEGKQDDIEMVQLLVKHKDAKLDLIDDVGRDSPIELAVRSNNLVMAKTMLPTRDYREYEYKRLLQLAAENNNAEMVEVLAEYGYQHEGTQLPTYLNHFLSEPWETDVNVAEIFMKYGGNPNYGNPVAKLVKRYHGDPPDYWDGSFNYVDGKEWKEEKNERRRKRIYVQVKTLLESGTSIPIGHKILGHIMDKEMTHLLLKHGGLSLAPKEYLNKSILLKQKDNNGTYLNIENGVVKFTDRDDGTLFEAMLEAQKQEAILEYLAARQQ